MVSALMYGNSTEAIIKQAGALIRETCTGVFPSSLLHAQRFPRNLCFTNQLGTVDVALRGATVA